MVKTSFNEENEEPDQESRWFHFMLIIICLWWVTILKLAVLTTFHFDAEKSRNLLFCVTQGRKTATY